MTTRKNSPPPLRVWVVGVEYKVRGTLMVEAATEVEAREIACDEMSCPPTCEITDWDTTSVREEQ